LQSITEVGDCALCRGVHHPVHPIEELLDVEETPKTLYIALQQFFLLTGPVAGKLRIALQQCGARRALKSDRVDELDDFVAQSQRMVLGAKLLEVANVELADVLAEEPPDEDWRLGLLCELLHQVPNTKGGRVQRIDEPHA